MRPGGVASRVACAAGTNPPPRTLVAALPERIMTLLTGPGSLFSERQGRFSGYRPRFAGLRNGYGEAD